MNTQEKISNFLTLHRFYIQVFESEEELNIGKSMSFLERNNYRKKALSLVRKESSFQRFHCKMWWNYPASQAELCCPDFNPLIYTILLLLKYSRHIRPINWIGHFFFFNRYPLDFGIGTWTQAWLPSCFVWAMV